MEESREFSSEAAAETDLSQYFAAYQVPQPGSDITLSALAQLAALRLNTARAFISLVDRTNQYILIEATQKSCLLPDSPRDDENDLLFGRATLPRSLGLCGRALDLLSLQKAGVCEKAWRQSPLIVNDLALDERFKDQQFVTTHPSVRFYAAMPISTSAGFSIGTLSVLGKKPREGLTNAETNFLGDLALAIVTHLEKATSNEAHKRSEKMIKGLSMFMEGRTDLGDWWLELGNKNPRRQQEPEDVADAENGSTKKPDPGPTPVPMSHVSTVRAPEGKDPEPSASLGEHAKPMRATPAGAKTEASCPVETSIPSTPGGGDAVPAAPKSGTLESQPHQSNPSETTTDAHVTSRASSTGHGARTIPSDFQESLVSKRLKEMFSRACHIIQQSIEVDGAIFLDASVSTLIEQAMSSVSGEGEKRSQASDDDPESSEEDPARSNNASRPFEETLTENQDLVDKACGVLGFCTGENSGLHRDGASKLKPLTEVFLQGLSHKYPQGHVFSHGDRWQAMSDAKDPGRTLLSDEAKAKSKPSKKQKRHGKEGSTSAEEKALLQMLPGTKSIAFIPLWDSHRERWFAGSFMWTVEQTTRVLTRTEDLYYLAAFGSCIMAEVARLDVVGADQAKSDFISSISHELRSPLHGILASVELLQDTAVDLFQHGMIDTIERCGRTLLDTIQHVLDFAKINNFTSFKRNGRAKGFPGEPQAPSAMPGLSVEVDLSLLTEDVVDSVFAGHEFQGNSSLVVTDEASGFPPEGLRRSNSIDIENNTARNLHTSKKQRIEVIMDIGWRPNWVFNTQSGALRRVLMNLLGNALKYTNSGWVKVSLQAEDIRPAASQPDRSIITISVKDTGRGISQDYFHSGLFTPFTQENAMNSGTGLGLSIVLQIVRSLGGTIDITSEQGIGTEVVVTLSMNQAPLAEPLPLGCEGPTMIRNARKMTNGLTIGLVELDDSPSTLERRAGDHNPQSEPVLFLQASIEAAAIHWFDMKVASPSTWKSSPPDIYITNENPGLRGVIAGVPTIVLCSHEALYREYSQRMVRRHERSYDDLVHFVSKPCGPHKLAKAFTFCLDKCLPQSSSSEVPSGTLASPGGLFQKSPEERMYYRMEHHAPDDYFHTVMTSEAIESFAHATQDPHPGKQKPMLLLVEDNEINLRLLSTFVSKSNYEYHTAVNGLLALQAVQDAQKPYDIVFMDISMPVMDGIIATREIRKLERSRRQKPCTIIALTGLGSTNSQQEAFLSGVNLFLTKPVRLNDLRKILSDWTAGVQPENLRI